MDVVEITRARQSRERREDIERRLRTQALEREVNKLYAKLDMRTRELRTVVVLALLGWLGFLLLALWGGSS